MDSIPLVDQLIDDGERLLDRLSADGMAVHTAFWTLAEGKDRWVLKVATPMVAESGRAATYQAVFASLRSLSDLSLSDGDIYLLRPDEEGVEDARRDAERGGGWWPRHRSLFPMTRGLSTR